jgi:hypothetical protein
MPRGWPARSSRIPRAPHGAPPLLSFGIERHGGIPAGSTPRRPQDWTINLEEATAVVAERDAHQVDPPRPCAAGRAEDSAGSASEMTR